MGVRRPSRRALLIAAAAGVALLLAGWLGLRLLPPPDRVQLLREAFEIASATCYEQYRGVELQACLAGAMEAHLQALGGMEPPDDGLAHIDEDDRL